MAARRLFSSLVLILIITNLVSGQNVGDIIKQETGEVFLNTLNNVQNQRELQKKMIKKKREKDPTWSPPKELGVPYLGAELGISHFRGEYLGLKAAVMGFNLFGGVAKEWVFKNNTDKNLFWYAGAGYFFGDTFDGTGEASLDITVGQSPICPDISIIGSFSMGYFFGDSKRFGIKGTLGLGAGDLDRDKPKFIWEFGAGVIVKIFADSM